MFFQRLRVGAADDLPCLNRLGIGAVGDHDIFATFHRRFVFQNTVLGDAHAEKSGPQRAQTAHHHRAFQSPDNPTDNRPGHEQRPNAGNQKEPGSKQQAPKPAPKGPQFSPVFHAVAGIVIADDVFIRVIVAAHDGEFFHVKPRLLEFLDGGFGFDVGFENCHDGIVLGHNVCAFIFVFFAFIADDTLGCRLAVRYGVLTLLNATAKGVRIVLVRNRFTKSFPPRLSGRD
jgi:hypothetical protein